MSNKVINLINMIIECINHLYFYKSLHTLISRESRAAIEQIEQEFDRLTVHNEMQMDTCVEGHF